MKIPSIGSIGSIALLGGLGFVIYKFIKGDWKLPSLLDVLGGAGLPTPAPETLAETGIVGGAGDIIYNTIIPGGNGDLRERAEDLAATQNIPFSKAVGQTVSEDIHGQGLFQSLLTAPVTIGAGLGAVSQWGTYLETLPPYERAVAERESAIKRIEFKGTPEGMIANIIGTSILPITHLFHVADVITATKPLPTATSPAITTPTRATAPKPETIIIPYTSETQLARRLQVARFNR
jgi:hypothetical protein